MCMTSEAKMKIKRKREDTEGEGEERARVAERGDILASSSDSMGTHLFIIFFLRKLFGIRCKEGGIRNPKSIRNLKNLLCSDEVSKIIDRILKIISFLFSVHLLVVSSIACI